MSYGIEEFQPAGATKVLYLVTEDNEPTCYVDLDRKNVGRIRDVLAYTKEPYAWPGGYPLVAFCEDGEVLCPTCVDANIDTCLHDKYSSWYVSCVEPYYEGPPLFCAHCGVEMKSAYGDPDEGPDNVAD